MTPVSGSSQIAAYGYDWKTKTLAVTFVGGTTYHYYDVPLAVWVGFDDAESKGSYFIRNIKCGPYRYEGQEELSKTQMDSLVEDVRGIHS